MSFEDFFGPHFFSTPLQMPEHGDPIPFHQLDRMLVVPSPEDQCVLVVLRDSHFPHAPGYGAAMTVREVSQMIGLLRRAIARIEEVPDPDPEEKPRYVDEDEPYD